MSLESLDQLDGLDVERRWAGGPAETGGDTAESAVAGGTGIINPAAGSVAFGLIDCFSLVCLSPSPRWPCICLRYLSFS